MEPQQSDGQPGFSRDDPAQRLDRAGYQAASLEAEQAFAAEYELVASSGRTGPGFDATTYGVQENLRDAASELEQAGPPEDDLDDAHSELAAGLRAFADGLEALEEQPLGGDPAAVLPSVGGLEQIRAAPRASQRRLSRGFGCLAARRLTIARLRYSISAMRRAALVGLATLAVAGCGGSVKDEHPAQAAEEPSVSVSQPPSGPPLTRPEYFQAVRAIVDGPAGDAAALFNALVAGELTSKECAQTAEDFGRVLDGIVEQAAAVVPPAHVAELHEKFVAAAGSAVAHAQGVLRRVEAGELACGEPLNEAIYGLPATEAAERVLSRIEAKGYVIFGQ